MNKQYVQVSYINTIQQLNRLGPFKEGSTGYTYIDHCDCVVGDIVLLTTGHTDIKVARIIRITPINTSRKNEGDLQEIICRVDTNYYLGRMQEREAVRIAKQRLDEMLKQQEDQYKYKFLRDSVPEAAALLDILEGKAPAALVAQLASTGKTADTDDED